MEDLKIQKNLSPDRQKALDDLLKDIPKTNEVIVNLPSKGKFYKLKDPTSPITLRPVTYDDELALVAANPADAVFLLLSRCLSNVSVDELFPFDRDVIFLKLREISFGNGYDLTITCPDCNKQSSVTIEMSDFPVIPMPEDLTPEFEITLPISKKKLTLRIPRLKDLKEVRNQKNLLNDLWRFVTKVEQITDVAVIANFLKSNALPLKDVHFILEQLSFQHIGVSTKFQFVCGHCEASNIMNVPFGDDFFR